MHFHKVEIKTAQEVSEAFDLQLRLGVLNLKSLRTSSCICTSASLCDEPVPLTSKSNRNGLLKVVRSPSLPGNL